MEKLTSITGLVVPLDRPNVDTDAIIPKQFLKSIKRSGFGPNLFDEWRYLDQGEPGMDNTRRPLNPDFVLNQSRYSGAEILLARENFGCGSSREHAPWALLDYGLRVILAPSYADIFFNNCFKNGILPVILKAEVIDELFQKVFAQIGYTLTVDLDALQIVLEDGPPIKFATDEFRRHCLLNGWDEIGLSLQHIDDIKSYERRQANITPWLFNSQVS
ncbi:MAG: 3-isopropylmalate dehydratase small subunit [Thiohalomonadales bacterium]